MDGTTAAAAVAVPGSDHAALADQLHGVGRLGIVLINVFVFSFGAFDPRITAGTPEQTAVVVLDVFVSGKVLFVLSFLFGYGLHALVTADRGGGRRAAVRRLAALAAVGLLHGVLLFAGDALLGLALLGLVVVALSGRTTRQLLWIAAGVVLVSLLAAPTFAGVCGGTVLAGPLCDHGVLQSATDRCLTYPVAVADQAVGQWGFELAAMLVGLVAARVSLLRDPAPWLPVARRCFAVAAPLAVGAAGVAALVHFHAGDPSGIHSMPPQVLVVAREVGGLLGGVAYVCLLVLLLPCGRRLPSVVSSAGRCSLSIGLSMSLIMVLLFSEWAVGLHDDVTVWGALTIAVGLWLLHAVAAQVWLRSHSAGPVEALVMHCADRSRPQLG